MAQEDVAGKLDQLSLQPPAGQSLNKKRSQRFTVQRNAPGPHPPLPGSDNSGSVPLNASSRDFNPVVGSMPSNQPDLVAPTLSGLAVPGSLPPRAPSPTSASLLPGQEESSDEIIPTALVLKNISFHASQEQMLALMESLGLITPFAFNFHYDTPLQPNAQPMFRGLAFANFRLPEEAAAAQAALNGYDIHGRKLRVEFKRHLRMGEKEKIEREKALRRMRSAQALKPDQEAADEPAPPLPQGHFANQITGAAAVDMGVPAYPFLQHQPYAGDSSPAHWQSSNASSSDVTEPYTPHFEAGASSASTSPALSTKTPPPSSGVRRPSQSAAAARTELDMNDGQTLEIYSRVLLFKDDSLRDELAFSKTLSGHQRRVVHLVAQKLGLEHRSVGEGNDRHAVVFKPGAGAAYTEDRKPRLSAQRSTGNLRKKSMPDMRSSTAQPGSYSASNNPVPPIGSLGLGLGGAGSRLSGRKSQGDLRSNSRGFVAQGPVPPVPLPPSFLASSSIDNNNNAGNNMSSPSSSAGELPPANNATGTPTRQTRSPSAATRNAISRAEQSSDWRAQKVQQEQGPSAQTSASLEF